MKDHIFLRPLCFCALEMSLKAVDHEWTICFTDVELNTLVEELNTIGRSWNTASIAQEQADSKYM